MELKDDKYQKMPSNKDISKKQSDYDVNFNKYDTIKQP